MTRYRSCPPRPEVLPQMVRLATGPLKPPPEEPPPKPKTRGPPPGGKGSRSAADAVDEDVSAVELAKQPREVGLHVVEEAHRPLGVPMGVGRPIADVGVVVHHQVEIPVGLCRSDGEAPLPYPAHGPRPQAREPKPLPPPFPDSQTYAGKSVLICVPWVTFARRGKRGRTHPGRRRGGPTRGAHGSPRRRRSVLLRQETLGASPARDCSRGSGNGQPARTPARPRGRQPPRRPRRHGRQCHPSGRTPRKAPQHGDRGLGLPRACVSPPPQKHSLKPEFGGRASPP